MRIIMFTLLMMLPIMTFGQENGMRYDQSEDDEQSLGGQAIESQRIKGIGGIPFGISREEAEKMIINKYGEPELSRDITSEYIIYLDKLYAGIRFDEITFLFQSDGVNSYFNGCVFFLSAKTSDEAEGKQEYLHDVLSKKYFMYSGKDAYGYKFYYGGRSPIPNDGFGFTIEVMKYQTPRLASPSSYAARLMYGRYNYIKEEF